MEQSADVDAYLAAQPEVARRTLEGLRTLVRELEPSAAESISYGVPTFKYRGRPLIYLAGTKDHCALYGTSKGTIRFPPSEPPPRSEVVAFVAERRATIDAALDKRRGKSTPAPHG